MGKVVITTAYSSWGFRRAGWDNPDKRRTGLGALETEVPLASCLRLTSPEFNDPGNPQVTSGLHPKVHQTTLGRMRSSAHP